MKVDFDRLPDDARIWVYTADRTLQDNEIQRISALLNEFIEVWAAHGKDLKAAYTLKYNCFLILGVDRNIEDASGCSIDKSVEFIKQIENDFSISFLNWQNLAYMAKDTVHLIKRVEFESKITENNQFSNISIFNNSVTNKGELTNNWIIPLRESSFRELINN